MKEDRPMNKWNEINSKVNKVWDNVRGNVWINVWGNVRTNVENNIWSKIRNNVSNKVYNNVRSIIRVGP